MMRFKKLNISFLLLILMGVLAGPLWAEHNTKIVVKAVLASQGSEYMDPRLSSLTEELQSVFRYSSYRLLSENRMELAMRETGTVSLPEDRVLKITPLQITGNRVELLLVILKKKKEVFQTVSQLLNHSSIIVGGPKYKDGYLLFNISASF
ncbi:MAG: hypothetical protein JSV01_03765 [Desulfobacterales bacterium]|nr:MAG: hypothetical protein JSV01_03765 [Desulfobacterales bacterium]UCG81301.1 MAG: hypothetical protein JSV60_03220 [Desulfobacterales bacterium]